MEINSDSVFMVLSEYLKFIGHWVKEYIELCESIVEILIKKETLQ